MNISYFIAGLIFLLNPNYGILDILPDVFGYALIWKAIEHSADLYEYLMDAKRLFGRMCMISVAKLGAALLCRVTDETFVLVLTFGFLIVELIYCLPAFIKLYNGIGYSAMRLGVPEVPDEVSKIRNLTVVFFVLKNLFALIPELTSLLYSFDKIFVESDYPATLKRNLSYIVAPLMAAFAIYVLVQTVKFLKKCRKNMYCNMIERSYEIHFSGREGLFCARLLNFGFSCMILASVFSYDFHYDMMDIVPDAAGGLILLVAVYYLSSKLYQRILGAFISLGYVASSVFNVFQNHTFHEEYLLGDVFYTAATTEKYVQLEIGATVEFVLGSAAYIFVICLLYARVKQYAKAYCYRMYAISPEASAADLVHEIRRSLIVCSVISILHFSGKALYVFILPYTTLISILSVATTVVFMLQLASCSAVIRQSLCEKIRDF